MKYLIADETGKEVEVEADRVEVTRLEDSDRVAFWRGEVIVAMFWDPKSFRQIDKE